MALWTRRGRSNIRRI